MNLATEVCTMPERDPCMESHHFETAGFESPKCVTFEQASPVRSGRETRVSPLDLLAVVRRPGVRALFQQATASAPNRSPRARNVMGLGVSVVK